MKPMRVVFLVGVVFFIGLQFVPLERDNPIPPGLVADPDFESRELQWVMRRSCYDCHSNETRWPVWAHIAPLSWFVVDDVHRARAILNFSEWSTYDVGKRIALRSLVNPVTATHRMPLWYYLPLHPDATLSEHELELITEWSQNVQAELPVAEEGAAENTASTDVSAAPLRKATESQEAAE